MRKVKAMNWKRRPAKKQGALQLFCLIFLMLSSPANGVSEVKNSVWNLGLNARSHVLRSDEGNNLLGNAASAQIGRGYLTESWAFGVSLDVITGPYESPEGKNLVVDFSGTGFTAFAAYGLFGNSFRTDNFHVGFMAKLEYADIIGRSVGQQVVNSSDVESSMCIECAEKYSR